MGNSARNTDQLFQEAKTETAPTRRIMLLRDKWDPYPSSNTSGDNYFAGHANEGLQRHLITPRDEAGKL